MPRYPGTLPGRTAPTLQALPPLLPPISSQRRRLLLNNSPSVLVHQVAPARRIIFVRPALALVVRAVHHKGLVRLYELRGAHPQLRAARTGVG